MKRKCVLYKLVSMRIDCSVCMYVFHYSIPMVVSKGLTYSDSYYRPFNDFLLRTFTSTCTYWGHHWVQTRSLWIGMDLPLQKIIPNAFDVKKKNTASKYWVVFTFLSFSVHETNDFREDSFVYSHFYKSLFNLKEC